METIRNYLESMFANLPNTSEVVKAKEELSQMMEDKYNELIADGVSDNAAVGTVISEFGNLDELAEELGINNVVAASQKDNRREISLDEAKEYLAGYKKKAFQIALGVALCILSMVGPIICGAIEVGEAGAGIIDGAGASLMFISVAAGVVLFIYSSAMMKKWDFIEKEACSMSIATSDHVKEAEASFTPKYALMLSIGVAMCIICFVPAMLLDEIEVVRSRVDLGDISGALMFVLVAIGVFLIVYASNIKGSFEKLFKASKRMYAGSGYSTKEGNVNTSAGSMSGDDVSGIKTSGEGIYEEERNGSLGNEYSYSESENDGKRFISSQAEFIMDVFWPTITCVYLSWSFLTFDWQITWIIWPIAAVLNSVLKSMLMKRV